MDFLNEYKKVLIRRLRKKGMRKNEIPGFVWALKSCLLDKPDMNYLQVNKRLQYLGWKDFVLDYHTMQLAIACFEAGDFNRSEKYCNS